MGQQGDPHRSLTPPKEVLQVHVRRERLVERPDRFELDVGSDHCEGGQPSNSSIPHLTTALCPSKRFEEEEQPPDPLRCALLFEVAHQLIAELSSERTFGRVERDVKMECTERWGGNELEQRHSGAEDDFDVSRGEDEGGSLERCSQSSKDLPGLHAFDSP